MRSEAPAPGPHAPPRVARVRQITDLEGQEQGPSLSPDGRTLVVVQGE